MSSYHFSVYYTLPGDLKVRNMFMKKLRYLTERFSKPAEKVNDNNFGRTYNKAQKHTTTKSNYENFKNMYIIA